MTTLSPPMSPQAQYEYGSRPAQNRERAVSSMSTVSASSRRSKESKKLELTESAKDKKRLNTKADPSKALAEATPAEVALAETTIEDLRTISHKDYDGNVIIDPDRSNPTRNRFERPLDTIRSFNAAAEGTSHRRSSYNSYGNRPTSQYGSDANGNRRTSYYDNGPMSPPRQRPAMGGYYRNSSYGFGPQNGSVAEDPQESQYYSRPPPRQPLAPYGNRNGHYNGNVYSDQSPQSPHSVHGHQPSYETMTSGSDENSKSTNPSSLNSSFDQLHQIRKHDGHGNVQQNPYAEDLNFAPVQVQKPNWNYGQQNGGYAGLQGGAAPPPPPPPAKEYRPSNPQQPIKLGTGSRSGEMPSLNKTESTKRQSWIKRKFSKKE